MRLRHVIAALTGALSIACLADDPPAKIDRSAPFLASYYGQSVPADTKGILVASVVLAKTQQGRDAETLGQVAKRQILKGLLGEAFRPSGTIAESIDRERGESESIDALRRRALAAVVVRYAPPGKVPTAPSPGYKHAGNGIWVLTEPSLVSFHLAMTVFNGLKAPVTEVSFTIGHFESGAPNPYYLFLVCKPEGAAAFAAGASQGALCSGNGHPLGMEFAIEALRKRSAATSLYSFRAADDEARVSVLDVTFSDRMMPLSGEADRVLSGVGCHALGTCEELSQREAARERKVARPGKFLSIAIAGSVLLLLASMLVGRRQAKGWFAPMVATLVIVTSVAAIASAVGLLRTTGGGWAGIEYVIILVYGAPVHVIAVLILALGMAVRGVSRYRVFALGLGLFAPALVWLQFTTDLADKIS